jgi:hypothetical protein
MHNTRLHGDAAAAAERNDQVNSIYGPLTTTINLPTTARAHTYIDEQPHTLMSNRNCNADAHFF